jgi:hypothetical protein
MSEKDEEVKLTRSQHKTHTPNYHQTTIKSSKIGTQHLVNQLGKA